MNKKQKIVIGTGLAFILLSGLFPAYEGIWSKTGDNYKIYLGYHFIFRPPYSNEVFKRFSGYESTSFRPQFYANIIFSRFLIQILTISILTIGTVFLFANLKKDKNGK